MRSVARDAAFNLYRFVLVDERSGFVRMALEAHQILRYRRSQLPRQEAPVRIVAVAALHHPFIDSVVEGPSKLLLRLEMAAVTELRRLLLHQELAFFGVMRRVAVDATYVVLQVRRPRVVAVLLSVRVASQAAFADFLGRGILECKDLRLIAATIDVCFPWTVTRLASMPLWTFFGIQRSHIVRRIFIRLVKTLGWHVLVAGLAPLGTDVERRVRRPFVRFRSGCGLNLFCTLLRSSGDDYSGNQRQYREDGNGSRKVATNRLRHSHPRPFRRSDQISLRAPSIHSKASRMM